MVPEVRGGWNQRLKAGDLAGGGAVAVNVGCNTVYRDPGVLHARFQQIDDGLLCRCSGLLQARDHRNGDVPDGWGTRRRRKRRRG